MVPSPTKLNRLIAEFQTLSETLPTLISFHSSAFLIVDEDDVSFMKLLVIGPSDTPYEDGCYIFDIFIPPTYPSYPPSVNLKIVDNFPFRFNPNLYDNGYVCLSLLGTWEGSNDERWDADSSSILQLILSIQSLIFVANPFYNEPGYLQTNEQQSNLYNLNIRQGNVEHSIINMLKKPSPFFNEIISTHFNLKKDKIVAMMRDWNIDSKFITKFQSLVQQ